MFLPSLLFYLSTQRLVFPYSASWANLLDSDLVVDLYITHGFNNVNPINFIFIAFCGLSAIRGVLAAPEYENHQKQLCLSVFQKSKTCFLFSPVRFSHYMYFLPLPSLTLPKLILPMYTNCIQNWNYAQLHNSILVFCCL